METLDSIFGRRSIRKYENKPIPKQTINLLIKAAMSAPSAGNEQPWHFIIINDPKLLKTIPTFHNHAQMLTNASVAILICCDLSLEKYTDMWVQDCSAATQNLLLAIHDLGLGGVWLGVYPRDQRIQGLKKLLKIPENVFPFSLIAIGYPAENKPPVDRFNTERIHENIW